MIVEGTNLTMIKGDSEGLLVTLQDEDDSPVPFNIGDTLYMTVKTSTKTATKEFQKVITTFIDGQAIIEIEPSDTREMMVGTYYYDIQITFEDGSVKTIIPPSQFKVEGDITYE